MKRINRIAALSLVALFLVALASPATAAKHGEDETAETTETTLAPVPISEEGQPAVVIPPPEIEEPEQPWTARFLIPLLVVTAILLIVAVPIVYNHTVRHRYEVVS